MLLLNANYAQMTLKKTRVNHRDMSERSAV